MGSFRTVEIAPSEASEFADLLFSIQKGQIDLAIVRGVIAPSECARVVSLLERDLNAWSWTLQETLDPEAPQFRLIGESLTPYAGHPEGPSLSHYFDEATHFRALCRELFGASFDFERRLEDLWGALGGGRAVELPAGLLPAARYTPATLRHLPPGCEIPVHVGNYFLTTPAYRHLATLVDLEDQLSYFIPLQNADRGGALVVYHAEWGKVEAPEMTRALRANWDDGGAPWPEERFAPAPGDLLVFNGGRYYHRVSRVAGERARWTIGGFVGFSPDGKTVRYWS